MDNENEIKEAFIKVLQYSQNINTDMNVDLLFHTWKKNKEYFYEAFGNRLIWESSDTITFHLDEKQRKFKYTCFIEKISEYWSNRKLAEYLRQLPPDDLFNNLISIDVNDYKYKGRKLLKVFKYFEEDKNVLFDMQNEASCLIQEDKINGILCFSIHPLDFLSLSENDHQWRSCHALDGDYRAGNLSYMLDGSTFICYVRSVDGNTHRLPNFPEDVLWNSKKWRRLFFLSDDKTMMFAGRPYPFDVADSLEIVKEKCNLFFRKDYPCNSFWGDWYHGSPTISLNKDDNLHPDADRWYFTGDVLKTDNKLFFEPEEPLHFNDLTLSSCYTPWYCYRTSMFRTLTGFTNSDTVFHIGHEVPCPVCGSRFLYQHDVMMCNKCWKEYQEDSLPDYQCSCCGTVIRGDVFWVEDEPLCEDCYDNETTCCDNCGERTFNEQIHYDRVRNLYLCKWCFDDINN